MLNHSIGRKGASHQTSACIIATRRDAFLLVHDGECDYQTVAAILGISVEAAEPRVCMVRKVLNDHSQLSKGIIHEK